MAYVWTNKYWHDPISMHLKISYINCLIRLQQKSLLSRSTDDDGNYEERKEKTNTNSKFSLMYVDTS